MIPKAPENKKTSTAASAFLPSTVRPDTLEALNKLARETGNRSFIVDKALRFYLGLDDEIKPQRKRKVEDRLAS
jgi:hypothetical protein